jgi:hypothetical protein
MSEELRNAIVEATKKFYSEDQPREANGRWGSGGSLNGAPRADSPSAHNNASQKAQAASHAAHEKTRKVIGTSSKSIKALGTAAFGADIVVNDVAAAVAHQFRDFTEGQREDAADSGAAMEDGSFPIHNRTDLMNARHSVGRAKDPEKAKAHVRKRAKELGLQIPQTFFVDEAVAVTQELAETVAAAINERFYSEDQAREPNGRWGGGSAEGKAAETAKTAAEHRAATVYHHKAANAMLQKGSGKGAAAAKDMQRRTALAPAAKAHRDAAIVHENSRSGYATRGEAHQASKDAHAATRAAFSK